GNGEPARRERAAADGRHAGIAAEDADVLERDAERVRDELRERSFHALALIGIGGDAGDGARRLEADRAAFLRRDLYPRRAIERRAGRVLLDESGEADAETTP